MRGGGGGGEEERENEGGGNEHSDEGTFKEKSANNPPFMTSFPSHFAIVLFSFFRQRRECA